MRLFWILTCLMLCQQSLWAKSANPYLDYPVGHIALEDVYGDLHAKRKDLRQCHQNYLTKIPGAHDPLRLEFQINPEGRAVPFANNAVSSPKKDALDCMLTIIRSISFPKPQLGIVFVAFESDLSAFEKIDIQKEPLSRNAVSLIPYMPQKMISSMIEMYMPYYKRCFQHAPKTNRPMHIDIAWTINTNGMNENLKVVTSPTDTKVKSCISRVTLEHRYPTGYKPTNIKRTFKIK